MLGKSKLNMNVERLAPFLLSEIPKLLPPYHLDFLIKFYGCVRQPYPPETSVKFIDYVTSLAPNICDMF